jgi:hypothetical protein
VNREPTARRRARRALARAALLAAAIAPWAATAEPRDVSPRAGRPARPTLEAPPPAAAEVPLPPPPQGTRLERRGATLGVGFGPWAGFGTGKSLAAHVDYGFPRTPVGWSRLELEYRLAVMVSRPSKDTTLTRTIVSPFTLTTAQIDTGVESTHVWLFEAVPTARLRLPFGPRFALLADGGLGLAQTVERYESDETFVGHTVRTKNVTGLVVRIAGGASLDVGERLRLLFLPVVLSFEIGPKYGGYAPSLGVAYRM